MERKRHEEPDGTFESLPIFTVMLIQVLISAKSLSRKLIPTENILFLHSMEFSSIFLNKIMLGLENIFSPDILRRRND